jgi:hypothetical protein
LDDYVHVHVTVRTRLDLVDLRVRPGSSCGITKLSQHESD